jgi:hypothetical protein
VSPLSWSKGTIKRDPLSLVPSRRLIVVPTVGTGPCPDSPRACLSFLFCKINAIFKTRSTAASSPKIVVVGGGPTGSSCHTFFQHPANFPGRKCRDSRAREAHVNTYFVNSYISIVERVNHTLLAETILTLSFPSGRPPFRFWFWKGWVFVFISSSVAFSKKGPWPLNVSSQKVAFRIIQLWPRPAVSSAPYTQDFRFEGVRHEKACEAAEKTALQGSFAATSGL